MTEANAKTTAGSSSTTSRSQALAKPVRLPKLIVRCATCHGEGVLRDGWAYWSVERQKWELGHCFDHAFCVVCEDERTIESVPAVIA